jgi:binding-protein-dependent transport system inner membrane component
MSERRPVRFRGGGFDPRPRQLLPWLVFVLVIAAWQAASDAGLLPALFMPSPLAVVKALYALWRDGTLAQHVGASLGLIIPGWIIGTAAGLVVGLAMGIFSAARAAGLPIVSALFPIPKIALLPLLILWFGIGEPSKVATIALGVFFPTVISAYSACDSVPRNLIRMGQSFGLPSAEHRQQDPGARRHAGHPGGLPDLRLGGSSVVGRGRDDRRAVRYRRLRARRRQPDADRPAPGRRGHAVDPGTADLVGAGFGRALGAAMALSADAS